MNREKVVFEMKKYCENCGKEVNTVIINKKEKFTVYGEDVEVESSVLTCADCGEELFCKELDEKTIGLAYSKYRENNKLLFPEEIKEIREKYELSQRSFAKLLNWGDKTIRRYENGAVQDKAHNSLLVFLREPENMHYYLENNKIELSERQLNNLSEVVVQLQNKEGYGTARSLLKYWQKIKPCEENGFKSFDYEKFCGMVLFFANKNEKILKTKLMKLLNYADMIFYKENGVSISGSRYLHFQFGPVPEKYDFIFGEMDIDNIAHIEVEYENGYEKHEIVPDAKVENNLFTPKEIDVMERVYNKFVDYGSSEISDYSHKEKGYKETKMGEIISYSFAKELAAI